MISTACYNLNLDKIISSPSFEWRLYDTRFKFIDCNFFKLKSLFLEIIK